MTAPWPYSLGELLTSASSASASTPRAGSIKAQGSRSGKALGIGELQIMYLLARAALVLHWIDHRYHMKAQGLRSGNVQIIKIMPGSYCQQ